MKRRWWRFLLPRANAGFRQSVDVPDSRLADTMEVLGQVFDQVFGVGDDADVEYLRRRLWRLRYRVRKDWRRARMLGIGAAITLILGLVPLTLILLGFALLRYMQYRDRMRELKEIEQLYQRAHQHHSTGKSRVAMEKDVLECAARHNGVLYPERLVLECGLPLAIAHQLLEQCVRYRIAQLEVDDRGRTYYYFPSLDQTS